MSSASSASGLSNRNISTATGVSASTAPARRPAPGPATRRTARYSTPTVATPMSASGTRIDHDERPNSRTESSMTHSDAGGLSTVIELPASEAPEKNASQFD